MRGLKPRACVWEITLACDLRCGHCGSSAGRPRDDELSTDEWLDVADSLARLGGQVVTLSGGEPTLRNDWDVIARAIRDRAMLPTMVTNGHGMSSTLAQRMRGSGLAGVAVSLDGSSRVHDRIRGPGTWRRACRALDLLADAGVPTGVITTVNKLNLAELEQIHETAAELGAQAIRFQLGKPMGNLREHRKWVLDPVDLLDLLPRISRLANAHVLHVGLGDSLGYYGPCDSQLRSTIWKEETQVWAGCQAGLSNLGIQSDGGVKGCLSLQAYSQCKRDPFLEGNVRKRSLEEIWLDPGAFAYNRSPVRLKGYCRSCSHARLCRGGARCVTTTLSDSWWDDPYCYHRVSQAARARPMARIARYASALASAATLVEAGCHRSPLSGAGGEDVGTASEPADTETGTDAGDGSDAETSTGGGIGPDTGTSTDAGTDTGMPTDTSEGTDTGMATDTTTDMGSATSTGTDTGTSTGTATATGTTDTICADEVVEWVLDYCCLPEPVNCAEVDCQADPIPVPEEVYFGCCVDHADYAYIPPFCTLVEYETLVHCCPDPGGTTSSTTTGTTSGTTSST